MYAIFQTEQYFLYNVCIRCFWLFILKLRFFCYFQGIEDVSMLTGEEINAPSTYLVFLNGLIVGVHERPIELVDNVRKLRRAGKIGEPNLL